jgi:beta-glucosidase
VVVEGRWRVPGIGTWKIPEARATLDYLGVNYYGRQFVHWVTPIGQFPGIVCNLDHHTRDVTERTLMGWDVGPAAFTQTLLQGARLGLPILVTEVGAWTERDEQRWSYIARHLAAMCRAMDQKAPIIGFLYWSLMDNFEWSHGYAPRFGLIEVAYALDAMPRFAAPTASRWSAHRLCDVTHGHMIRTRLLVL